MFRGSWVSRGGRSKSLYEPLPKDNEVFFGKVRKDNTVRDTIHDPLFLLALYKKEVSKRQICLTIGSLVC